jgi:hypothetical protein
LFNGLLGADFVLGVETTDGELRAPRNVTLRARVVIEELRSH